MTPNGISALYCPLDRETCLSEIRSITGDPVVSVGLTPIAELKSLDLTILNCVEPAPLTLLEVGFRESWPPGVSRVTGQENVQTQGA